MAAAIAGALVSRAMHAQPLVIQVFVTDSLTLGHYLLFAALGLVCAGFGVAVMRLVGLTERAASRLPIPKWARPALGGVLLAALAWQAPSSLSAGHGAMRLDLFADLSLSALMVLIAAKAAASVVSLGFGFRGGLFFASLYLGALIGRLFVVALAAAGFDTGIDPLAGALVGMGALAVAIIGGPVHHDLPGAGDHRRLRPHRRHPHRLDGRRPRWCARPSAIPSPPGDCTCAARPSAAPTTSAGCAP